MRRLALVLALLVLAGCTAQETPVPETPDEGVVETVTCTLPYFDEGGWDPLATRNELNLPLFSLAYEGLYELDGAFRATPVLADQATRVSANVWQFRLVPATFSDGSPVTAYDVAASYARAREPSSAYAGRFQSIDTVRALDRNTVEITTTSPNALLPRLLDVPITAQESADGIAPGTGAYVFTAEGTGYALIRRQNWRDEAAFPFDRIALTPVGSLPQLSSALTAKEISLAAIDATDTSASWSGDYTRVDYPSTRLQYLGFNCRRIADAETRVALSRALDRAGAVADYAGLADAAPLPVHPAAEGYDAALETPLSYDAAAARAALAGRGLSLTILVNAENTGKVSLANRLADCLSAAGVNAAVDAVPFSDFLTRLEAGNFDLFLGEVRLAADFDVSGLIAPSGALNYGGYSSTELSAALYAARDTGDPTEFLRLFAAEAPFATVLWERDTLLMQKDFFRSATPVVANPFYHFYDWASGL